MEPTLLHIVFISFHPDASEEKRNEIYNLYQTLAEDCGGREAGILFFQVDWNMDSRKNVHLVEVAIFTDSGALQKFRNHPKHKELTNLVQKIADWQVGDIHMMKQL